MRIFSRNREVGITPDKTVIWQSARLGTSRLVFDPQSPQAETAQSILHDLSRNRRIPSDFEYVNGGKEGDVYKVDHGTGALAVKFFSEHLKPGMPGTEYTAGLTALRASVSFQVGLERFNERATSEGQATLPGTTGLIDAYPNVILTAPPKHAALFDKTESTIWIEDFAPGRHVNTYELSAIMPDYQRNVRYEAAIKMVGVDPYSVRLDDCAQNSLVDYGDGSIRISKVDTCASKFGDTW
jgi:hypothetical protein